MMISSNLLTRIHTSRCGVSSYTLRTALVCTSPISSSLSSSYSSYSFYSTSSLSSSSSLRYRSSFSSSSSLSFSSFFTLRYQRRYRGFHFYLNLNDPEETRRRVEEDIALIEEKNGSDTMKHLHALLNLALSYYQSGDYLTAHEYAEYTHEKARKYNKNATFLYFTAKTCARCALAVAEEYENHLREMEEKAAISSTLTPRPSVVFSAERAIAKLREDAVRYDGIAQRLCNRPDKAFMRAADMGSTTGWSEDTRGEDEEPNDTFGNKWKERRKRPEHAAIRQYYQQQQQNGNGVPK
ncbi:uncharacterized protein TM35_000031420 [Trypanosoma theileri]|uniref:Uncharacterized protein n=1 Tax=Trypanosoma theileri TaxID=67003 RepID=A0A1X0P732_9TRYP|nr:uncharacterized protein TM35_000031420 [Trypanosoma theileri]ORC92389.1 hypothetical protein TM35_000031420 [Trypanosoma theileri]